MDLMPAMCCTLKEMNGVLQGGRAQRRLALQGLSPFPKPPQVTHCTRGAVRPSVTVNMCMCFL